MARGERTGHVKAATRIRKLRILIERDPSRAATLEPLINTLLTRLADAKCCLGCGRPLSDADSIGRGYGSECWKRLEDNG